MFNQKEYCKKWRQLHPNYLKEWRIQNPIKTKNYCKKYYQKHWKDNKEHILLIRRKRYWRLKKEGKLKPLTGLRYQKKLYFNLRRWVQKKNAEGTHTFQEWQKLKEKFNYTCLMCGKKEPEIKLTEDHIIPLSRGGSDYITNIQPLCRSCNSKKFNRLLCLLPSLKNVKQP